MLQEVGGWTSLPVLDGGFRVRQACIEVRYVQVGLAPRPRGDFVC